MKNFEILTLLAVLAYGCLSTGKSASSSGNSNTGESASSSGTSNTGESASSSGTSNNCHFTYNSCLKNCKGKVSSDDGLMYTNCTVECKRDYQNCVAQAKQKCDQTHSSCMTSCNSVHEITDWILPTCYAQCDNKLEQCMQSD